MARIYKTLPIRPGGIFDLHLGIFVNSRSLVFIPSELQGWLYPMIALEEEGRLRRLDSESNLTCGHTPEEHAEALRAICMKFTLPQSN